MDPAEQRQKVHVVICNHFVGAFLNIFQRICHFLTQVSKFTHFKTLSRAKSERRGPGGQPPPRQSASRSLVRIQDRTMSLSDDGSRQRPHPRQHARRRLTFRWSFGMASGTLSPIWVSLLDTCPARRPSAFPRPPGAGYDISIYI